MSEHVVTLEIGRERVIARTPGGGKSPPGKVDLDPLRKRTIQVLADAVREDRLNKLSEFEVLGSHLYRTVFSPEIESFIQERISEAELDNAQLLLQLTFEADAGELETFPWEYLHKPEPDALFFLATREEFRLARFTARGSDEDADEQPEGPLRVLLSIADPESLKMETAEIRKLCGLAQVDDRIEVQQTPGEGDQLIEAVNDFKPHVLHFVGHGRLQTSKGEDNVAILNEDGGLKWVPDVVFAQLFAEMQPAPALVLLHLAKPQEAIAADVPWSFSEVAPRLVQRHVHTVVAMHYPIDSLPATEFCKWFYRGLMNESPIAEAVQKARFKTAQRGAYATRAFGAPVLYMHRPRFETIVKIKAKAQDQGQESVGARGVGSLAPATAEAPSAPSRDAPASLKRADRGEQVAPGTQDDRFVNGDGPGSAPARTSAELEEAPFGSGPEATSPAYLQLTVAAKRRVNELDSPEADRAYRKVLLLNKQLTEEEQISRLFGWTSETRSEHARSVFGATAASAIANRSPLRVPGGDSLSQLEKPLAELICAGAAQLGAQDIAAERKDELDRRLMALVMAMAEHDDAGRLTLLEEASDDTDEEDWMKVVVALIETVQDVP